MSASFRPTWSDVQDQRSDFQTLIARDMHESDRMDLDNTPIPPPAVRCLPRKRTLYRTLRRAVLIAWYRFDIWSLESWIHDCAKDGILQSRSLSECHMHLAEQRVRLAIEVNS